MKKVLSSLITVVLFLSVFSVIASAADSAPSPIAVYNFEDSNNIGKDVSGNKNNLTAKGNAKQSASGKYGKGISFDAYSALVSSSNKNGVDFVDAIEMSGSKKMTLMYWVKYTASDFDDMIEREHGWRRIVSNGNDSKAGYGGYGMLSLADNYIVPTAINPACVFYTEKLGTSSVGNWSTYPYTEEWTNIAWTVDITTGHCIFYVNGTPIFDLVTDPAENGSLMLYNTQRLFAIGANYYTEEGADVFAQPFYGLLDDFYVFDSVLDADQITYYMNNNYTVPAEAPETSDSLITAMTMTAIFSAAVITVTVCKKKMK